MMAPAIESVNGCPVCGSRGSLRLVQRFQSFTLQHCPRCNVQHWSPLVHPGSVFYEGEQVPIYSSLHEGREDSDDPRFAKFNRLFPGLRGKSILDIGCSNGAFLSAVKGNGNYVWGIDIDGRAVSVARERGLANVIRAEIPEFARDALSQGLSFDLITAFDVLEHLVDPVGTLKLLAPLLAPGGRLVGTVPNRRRLLANAMPIDFPPHHFYRYDERAMARTLRQAGFHPHLVEAFQYGYTMRTALAWALRSVRRRARPGRGGGSAHPSAPSATRRGQRPVLLAYEFVAGPLNVVLERPGRRGFKLFFVAEFRGR